ncbi:hypothetical protein MNBD_NITROSPINAE04-1028 [hydrothermal vent metagenome]|uniref:Uncharacterized protein n=1 Tax=hydrothermal vent metagenome TaxID=652676 RepID=A0A3B1C850_9ZZZZ
MVRYACHTAAVIAFALHPGTGLSQTSFEIFEIHYSDAGELEGAVMALLSGNGKVSVNSSSNSLIVKDNPRVLKQVRQMIARLDRKLKNIRIEVEFIEKALLNKTGVNIKWGIGGSGWSVGVAPGVPGGSVSAGLTARRSDFKGKKKQFIVIMENRPGRIFVGESIPLTNYFFQYGKNHGYLTQNTQFKNVGVSFSVKASVAGKGKLRITLAPEVSYYDRRRNSFPVKNAAVTLVMDDPGAIVIASSDDNKDSFSVNFLRGMNKEDSESQFAMILTARSEK